MTKSKSIKSHISPTYLRIVALLAIFGTSLVVLFIICDPHVRAKLLIWQCRQQLRAELPNGSSKDKVRGWLIAKSIWHQENEEVIHAVFSNHIGFGAVEIWIDFCFDLHGKLTNSSLNYQEFCP